MIIIPVCNVVQAAASVKDIGDNVGKRLSGGACRLGRARRIADAPGRRTHRADERAGPRAAAGWPAPLGSS